MRTSFSDHGKRDGRPKATRRLSKEDLLALPHHPVVAGKEGFFGRTVMRGISAQCESAVSWHVSAVGRCFLCSFRFRVRVVGDISSSQPRPLRRHHQANSSGSSQFRRTSTYVKTSVLMEKKYSNYPLHLNQARALHSPLIRFAEKKEGEKMAYEKRKEKKREERKGE